VVYVPLPPILVFMLAIFGLLVLLFLLTMVGAVSAFRASGQHACPGRDVAHSRQNWA
jgi:hypothetical protein